MPADVSAAAVALSRQRRIGLRVALAVAAGFTLNLATGEVIPFFGPVLAVQFLIFGAGPLSHEPQMFNRCICPIG
jgi:hypothetical protein